MTYTNILTLILLIISKLIINLTNYCYHKRGAMHLHIIFLKSFSYHKGGAMHLECKFLIESL